MAGKSQRGGRLGLAPTLVNLVIAPTSWRSWRRLFDVTQLPPVVTWLGATYNVYSLLAEVSQGPAASPRSSGAQSYVYLDQAPVQAVDIQEGLDNTLLILRSKLSGIAVPANTHPTCPRLRDLAVG